MKTTETGFLRRLREAPIEDAIAGTALVVVVGSVLWGVFTRYLLTQPAPWSYEVATIGFAWLVFFAAAAGVRYRMHSDVDVLVVMFSPRWQRVVAVFNFWLIAGFFAALTVFFAVHAVDAHKSVTIALNLPRSVIHLPLSLACLMMLLRHVEAWLRPADGSEPVYEANIT